MPENIVIRPARESDAPALVKIYAPYVAETAITFEYDVPSAEEFAARIRSTMEKYAYLVMEKSGEIVGYAYAGIFHSRPAYDWAVETSIYMKKDLRGKGLGSRLYLALEEALKAQNIINCNACIAYMPEEDEHLTHGSVLFHEKMGYRMVGEFKKCGYKFGKWYGIVWMEKHLTPHPDVPSPVIPFSELTGVDPIVR